MLIWLIIHKFEFHDFISYVGTTSIVLWFQSRILNLVWVDRVCGMQIIWIPYEVILMPSVSIQMYALATTPLLSFSDHLVLLSKLDISGILASIWIYALVLTLNILLASIKIYAPASLFSLVLWDWNKVLILWSQSWLADLVLSKFNYFVDLSSLRESVQILFQFWT